jgi:hypothetical protein
VKEWNSGGPNLFYLPKYLRRWRGKVKWDTKGREKTSYLEWANFFVDGTLSCFLKRMIARPGTNGL